MSQLKKLASETAIYGISSILGRMLNYLLVPLYTSFFAPHEYGIVTELYAYTAFLIIIYTYGIETAYFRFATRDKTNEKAIYNNGVTSLLISSLFLSLLLVSFATPIVNYLEYPGRERYVYWFAAILAIDAVLALPFAKLRLENRPVKFAVAKLANIFINILLNLFFIVVLHKIYQGEILPGLRDSITGIYNPRWDADYVFLSNLIANAALIFILGKLLLQVKLSFDWKMIKPMLVYAYPLLFMGLAGATNEMLSRAMLKKILPDNFYPEYSNLAALGIFGACYKLSIFMTLAIQAFRYAAEPFFFSKSQDKNSPFLFRDVMHWFIIFGSLIFLVVSLNLDLVASVFLQSDIYWEGLEVVPVLLLANLFLGIYYNLSIWFKLTDRTYFGTYISFLGAAITIGFNFWLIPIYGYQGSAVVTLITYLTMTILNYFLGQKHYPIPYRLNIGLFYIVLAVVIYYLVLSIPVENEFAFKVIGWISILIYMGIIYFAERKRLKNLLSKNKAPHAESKSYQ